MNDRPVDPALRPDEFVARIDAAAKRHETPSGAGRMVWRSWGSGPVLVLLHGGHGAWSHWIRNIPALAERYTVIAADMPGYGDSDPPPLPFTPEGLAGVLKRGLDEVIGADTSFSITGFSFGGAIGGHLAWQGGSRVRRIVLVGSGGLGVARAPMRPMRNWRMQRDAGERLAAHRENLGILMLHDPASIDTLAVYLQLMNTSRTRMKSRPVSLTDTLRRALEQVSARIGGIWGEFDATAVGHLEERAQVLRQIQPEAPFVVIPGAGHWVQYEAADAFNAALLEMLSKD
jgi:2-hydroxy-6-oxonona-2,4-dienedioate hydrolase